MNATATAIANMHGGQPGQPYDCCKCKAKRCKAYSVVIELEIQRVTCPGVWLCNNGKVTIQIFLLGLCTQTSAMNPTFPLLCHEKFIFRKNFANIQNLVDIDRKLDKEIIYMELIQWEDCSTGNVLGTFKTTLNDLLYPFPCYKGVVAGVDVDLLMEATRIFPGIIAPKIEVSTKLTIEEVLCSLKQEKQTDVLVINPKLISSKCVPKRNVPMHQKRVCHNNKYHTSRSSASPQNRRRSFKPLGSTLSNHKICSCVEDKINIRAGSKIQEAECVAKELSCNLCKKYKNYFQNTHETAQEDGCNNDEPTTVTQYKVCKCCNPPKAKPTNSWKEPPEKPTIEKICSCKVATQSPSSKKGSKKEINLCACDGDVKPVCKCKACKGCALCEEKKTSNVSSKSRIETKTQKGKQPQEKKKHESINFDLPRANSTPLPLKGNSLCDSSCNQTFYRNLENFYKQLYLRAHYKLKNELCKCEGEGE